MDTLAFTSGPLSFSSKTARVKTRSFRIIRRGRFSDNTTTPFSEVYTRIGCQGRVLCPCALATLTNGSISSRRLARLRSSYACYAQMDEEGGSIEEGSGFSFQSVTSTKPLVWNPSYKKRLDKFGVGSDFLHCDSTVPNLENSICGLCESQDSDVSRRTLLRSIIQGRTKDIGYQDGSPGNGGNDDGINDRRGYGGGDDDGEFGSNEPLGWGSFFFSGARGWLLIAAGIALVSSVCAQIFRSTGRPRSRADESVDGVATSDSSPFLFEADGARLQLEKGGSLSHAASNIVSVRGTTQSGRNELTPLWNFALGQSCGLWTGSQDSISTRYRGLLHVFLYPTPKAYSQAFYRQAVRMVGPKPGDWVETVDAQEEVNYELLNRSLEDPGGLDGVVIPTNTAPETSTNVEQNACQEEIYELRDELKCVRQVLIKSEAQKQETLQKLEETNAEFEEKELALRTKIKDQEDTNQKIRKRLRKIDADRRSLLRDLEEAKIFLSGINPEIEEADGHVNELTNEIQTYKTSLRLLENQLVSTSRERDAVVRRMEALIKDVHDMECVLEVAQKSQELIVASENEAFADKIKKTDACIQALQRFDLKPNGARHLSPIQEVNQRVVIVFNRLLSEMKRSFNQSSKCVTKIEEIQKELSYNLQGERELNDQLSTLKEQLGTIQLEKESSESMMASLQHDLVNVHQQLDGSTDHEKKLTQVIEDLTCDKDRISEMARKFKKEIDGIENLMSTMENTKKLILQSIPNEMGVEHITMLENCISGIQHQQLELADSSSPVTESITNRLVKMFEELLFQTKQWLVRSEEAKKSLKRVEEDLTGALAQEHSLNLTVEGLKSQLNEMTTSKCNLSNDVSLLKSEVEEKVRNLDALKMELVQLDQAHDEQTREIESLQEQLESKKQMVQDSKQVEVNLMEAIKEITEERDNLLSKLDSNETDLDQWKASLEEVIDDRKKIQEDCDALQAEKNKLETQLSGLSHRINDFESENSRLNSVANTLRSNLDNERREKEQLEQEAGEFLEEHTDLNERFTSEVQELKERLDDAQKDCLKLKETCANLEQAKKLLEKQLQDEHEKFNSQLEKLKEQHQNTTGPSSPTAEAIKQIPESPFVEHEVAERSHSAFPRSDIGPMSDQAPQSQAPGASEARDGAVQQPESSKVRSWLENAEVVDPFGSVPSERNVVAAPPMEKKPDEILESLMPAAGGKGEQRIFRRSSWPQDMNNALSDNLFGAAQELVDMTTATLALAAEKNGLEEELQDIRQVITETRAQLAEREAEVGELTEHFLQVYQIANDLATDNEEQSNELRELRLMYERQKQDIEVRDERLAYMETEFAMLNKAPPRIPMSKSHYSESVSSFPAAAPVPMSPPISRVQRLSRDYSTEFSSRLNSTDWGDESSVDVSGRSPRFDAPKTPPMVGTGLELVGSRAKSSATNISVPTRQCEEVDLNLSNCSYSDMSSLSGADDEEGSNVGYPENDHYPIQVDAM
eukprot:g8669.t1